VFGAVALVVVVMVASPPSPVEAPAEVASWYLNGRAGGQPYRIFRFGADGAASPSTAVVAPSGTGFDAQHVAWPSAIRTPHGVFLYASGFDGIGWNAVGLWVSQDGVNFRRKGPVLRASADEPRGIGPAQVTYDPQARHPFGMYYLVRGSLGPGHAVRYATSDDGEHWKRRGGLALVSTRAEERSGLAVGYVCRARDGQWHLFYGAYPTINSAVAMVASSRRPGGPFARKHVLMKGDGISVRVRSAPRGTDMIEVHGSKKLIAGSPYLLAGSGGLRSELVVVNRIFGTTAYLDRRTLYDHDGDHLMTITRSKLDPSYAREAQNGWDGIFTAYGPIPGVTAEYTVRVRGRDLKTSWRTEGSGVAFEPNALQTQDSLENPTPLVEGPDCL